MKLYFKLFIWTTIMCVVTLALSACFYYVVNIPFVFNICIGIFASSLVLLVNSLIGFYIERKKEIKEIYLKLQDCDSFALKIQTEATYKKDVELPISSLSKLLNNQVCLLNQVYFDVIRLKKNYISKKIKKELNSLSNKITEIRDDYFIPGLKYVASLNNSILIDTELLREYIFSYLSLDRNLAQEFEMIFFELEEEDSQTIDIAKEREDAINKMKEMIARNKK